MNSAIEREEDERCNSVEIEETRQFIGCREKKNVEELKMILKFQFWRGTWWHYQTKIANQRMETALWYVLLSVLDLRNQLGGYSMMARSNP